MMSSQDCPQPVRRAVMKQGWYDLAYIHYRYKVEEVARILPSGLEVDVCDGSAWVGLIPFSMRGIGVPGLPSVPYLGSFPEVNVRTYVRRNGILAFGFVPWTSTVYCRLSSRVRPIHCLTVLAR